MTDETEHTPDSEIRDEAVHDEETPPPDSVTSEDDDLLMSPADTQPVDDQMYALIALETEGLDIDEALAAVASLSDLVAEKEAAADAAAEAEEAAVHPEKPDFRQPTYGMPRPPLMTLQRGQMASVVPALLLILLGVWLTFALTTSTTSLDPGLMVALASGGIGISLLAQWQSSGRWSSGSFFFGITFLLAALVLAYLLTGPGVAAGWPLFIVAVGAAVTVSALLIHPSYRRLGFAGAAIICAGLAGLAVTSGLLNGDLVAATGNFWPVVLVIVLVIALIPGRGRE